MEVFALGLFRDKWRTEEETAKIFQRSLTVFPTSSHCLPREIKKPRLHRARRGGEVECGQRTPGKSTESLLAIGSLNITEPFRRYG